MINYNTTLSNKEIDKIETKEETKEIKGNNTFAIMLKGKEDNTYKPSDKNTWPESPYKYAGSLCIGNDGRDIEESEVISFNNDNHTATITTKDTIYCYLYFVEGEDAVTRIERLSSNSLENKEDVKAREDVLRRFQGTYTDVTNNYICFGTSITEECTKNIDRYMYRIIGYATDNDGATNTKAGQLKLIKKEALEEPMQWHYNYNDNVNWFQSDLYKRISTKEYLQNSYYVPSGWENKIADHTWWTGDVVWTSKGAWQDGAAVYKIETGKEPSDYYVLNMETGTLKSHVTNCVNQEDPYCNEDIKYDNIQERWTVHQSAKAGLTNLSDYYLAYGGKGKLCAGNGDCKNSWLHLSNNDSKAPNGNEWTITHYGFRREFGLYQAMCSGTNGAPGGIPLDTLLSVRPVIYTIENITLNGSGTIDDPFIIL